MAVAASTLVMMAAVVTAVVWVVWAVGGGTRTHGGVCRGVAVSQGGWARCGSRATRVVVNGAPGGNQQRRLVSRSGACVDVGSVGVIRAHVEP